MDEKQLLIQKFGLKHEDNAWYSEKENSHKHLIFKDSFVERTDVIGLLFRINKLCMAKVKYFRGNIDKFEPLKYDYKRGFIVTELWDAISCGIGLRGIFSTFGICRLSPFMMILRRFVGILKRLKIRSRFNEITRDRMRRDKLRREIP